MSSSPPSERTAPRWRPAGWSLRTRLSVALVAIVAGVCALIGVGTTIAVYQVQLARLDSHLAAAVGRTQGAVDHRPGPDDDGPGRLPPPQDLGTISTVVSRGDVHAQQVYLDGTWQNLTAAQAAVLFDLPGDGQPHTRDIPGLGPYRLTVGHAGDGDPLYTGLPMTDVYATSDAVIVLETAIGLAAALLAGLIGATVIGRNLRPLRRVAATASRVAELPLDRGEVALSVRVPAVDTDPRTEVGQVGAALNRMLGHVADALAARQASETRVRHFVADASHELRTPLAAIRGYAELTRRVSDAVPPDVAHAMRRVESETTRMTALVEDMLLLARLDSGRPLQAAPVDLSRLVIDAVSDAHVAAPDHHWRLDLPEESVTVTGDPARLHQVLANLLANARTHTPPGTTVTVSLVETVGAVSLVEAGGAVSLVEAGAVTLTVADDGPGIPANLLPEVFDRFARGDTSRSRAAGSTGLGLSIVAAVVEAHHGTAEVASRPGHTEFRVRLPVVALPDGGSGPPPGAGPPPGSGSWTLAPLRGGTSVQDLIAGATDAAAVNAANGPSRSRGWSAAPRRRPPDRPR
ncbi:MAG: HAMP domain-containing protein [Actinobacteria bacterium]|nr:MAG: HAMP domain-containing protein [Actinomycetota bacterium]